MLKSLYIKNYAIIDELNIDFSSGFNVFTGETGAGKSIIVGALSFLVRGKADTSIIRTGQDKAIIEGVFSLEDSMKDKLNEADIEYEDELIVRRTFSLDNHNSIKVNNVTVTLNFLNSLFQENIDIHSQADSQYLLNKANHLTILNKYCDYNDLLNEYKNEYNNYLNLQNEYNDLQNNKYSQDDLERFKFELAQLEEANLNTDEEIDLQNKEKRYKEAEKYISLLNNIKELYSGSGNIKTNLYSLIKEINIDDEQLQTIKENISNLYYSLDDEVNKIYSSLDDFDENMDIEYIEDRLFTYSKLKRKYNMDVQELINHIDTLKNSINLYIDKDRVLTEKKAQLDKQYNVCFDLANNISSIRKEKALNLEKEVIKETEDLMLNNVQFKVMFNESSLNRNGIDNIEFYISLNKGEALKPLKEVASGGEMSRLMLSLKTVFSKLSDIYLIIFDEIDTGVSGKVGLAMGQKMKEIAKDKQVLTITHLASVAACANDNYYIYKTQDSNTRIKKLEGDEIINELANIANGELTDNSIAAARELYKTAQNEN